jgi:hypothetical protein
MRNRFAWAGGALLGALLALALMFGGSPVALAQNVACFMQQGGAVWVAGDGCTWQMRSGSTLAVESGSLTSLGGVAAYPPTTPLSLTMNGWLTPTGTFQPIESAGAVSISGADIADGEEGQLLFLVNVGAQTITISETTGLISAGNIALGAGDSATLLWRTDTWHQVAASNN